MPSFDQSAELRISIVATPDQAAVEQATPMTECALNVSVSTPVSWRHVLRNLAMVLLETGSCFLIHDKNRVDLNSPVLTEAVHFSYTCKALPGHNDSFVEDNMEKNSLKGFDEQLCLDR